ncbi:MAG TPA: LTA synthase family protein, partial [Ginsengibacter sp.]|nr:LTA synthase family protein [Ginsengibacter sp.]
MLLIFIINKSYKIIEKSEESKSSITKFFYGLVFTLLLALGIFGRFGQYPLRWSDAFSLKDDFKANLALNPIQSFFSTLEYRSSGYDEALVKKYYPLMADYLGVNNPDNKNLNFSRFVRPKDSIQRNVVIVICESFSAYKSTMFGNGLNTTPYFNDLCNDGLFFDRCFTPSYGTARGIWAVITGIPDVEYPNTSSRNPSYVDQHSIINDFAGYSKYYFIGGSSSWANIRGLLTNNLNGLHLLEEEDFNAKKIDVWGISDKRLLLAANDTFATLKKPFVAIVQTADNHRPYTIPDEDRNNFDLLSYPKDTLHKYGFSDNDELNAFRYTDFAFRAFMEAAKKEAYFKNTIFVFVGDHGIKGNASAEFPEVWNSANLTSHHVPLLFYAPGIITPQRNGTICSQVDVLPTAASLAGIPYNNTTMGIDLASESGRMLSFPAGAFLFDPTIKQ